MRVFTTHLWKEWREHRAVLLGILVALPVLTAATFVGFASFGAQLANGAAVFTGGAAAMTALALSVELFAGEVTRRTLGFWRRQPGGLAVGGLAKVAMLLLAVSVATVWGGLCFWTACRTFVGARAAETAWASLSTPEYALAIPFLSLVLASWILLTSTWVARGAAAVGIALLLLAAIAAPGAVLWGERTAYLKTLIPGVAVTALAGIAFPLAVAGLSLFVGRRRTDRPFRAALACFGVIVLGGGAAYAHANMKLERWLDVRLDDADARVRSVLVGTGGRYVFADIGREGDDWLSRPIAIDTQSGEWRLLASAEADLWTAGQLVWSSPMSGLPLVQVEERDPNRRLESRLRYIDGATGAELGAFRWGIQDDGAADIVRRALRDTTPVRTTDGRRAWSMTRRIAPTQGQVAGAQGLTTVVERERSDGSIEQTLFGPESGLYLTRATPYGWCGVRKSLNVFVPADARSVEDCVPYELEGYGGLRLDAARYVYRRYHARTPEWRVMDVRTRVSVPAPGLVADDVVLSLEGESALVWSEPPNDPKEPQSQALLLTVDLRSGRRSAPAERAEGIPTDLRTVRLVGTTAGGFVVLSGRSPSSTAPVGFLAFDRGGNRLREWTPNPTGASARWIGDDGTLLVSSGSLGTTDLYRIRLGTVERTRILPR